MSDPNLILKDTGSVEQTNRLVCMYAETIFQHEQTLCHIFNITQTVRGMFGYVRHTNVPFLLVEQSP